MTTDNSVAQSSMVHTLESIKSVVKVYVVPKPVRVEPASDALTQAKALAFIDSLSVKSGKKVPADERGIEARIINC